MGEIWNTQKETYRVQNIGLAAAVQSCDGVEEWVKAVDLRPLRVGLESFDNNRLDVHLSGFLSADSGGKICYSQVTNHHLKQKAPNISPVFTTDNWETASLF